MIEDSEDSLELFGPPEGSKLTNAETIKHNLGTLSHSALLSLHSCPRKFELQRILPKLNIPIDQDEKGHLAFGTIVGNGVQEYLVTRSLDKALFRAFLDWTDYLDSEKGAKSAKTFWHAMQAVRNFISIANGPLGAYEVAVFNGKPATELGYEILFDNGFRLRGLIDALLVHKVTREYLVLECKTTGARVVDAAMYKNSAQAVGYGVVIDAVVAQSGGQNTNSYKVIYPVYKTFAKEWEVFMFPKTNLQRILWIQDILIDINHIEEYLELGYFPMRGESCFAYGNSCQFLGICNMDNSSLIPEGSILERRKDEADKFPLKFKFSDIVQGQVGRNSGDN